MYDNSQGIHHVAKRTALASALPLIALLGGLLYYYTFKLDHYTALTQPTDLTNSTVVLPADSQSTRVINTNIALNDVQPMIETDERIVQDAGFSIQFTAGQTVLKGRAHQILLELANVLQRYPDLQLEAHGFSDSKGNPDTNKVLSQARAQTCIDVIANAGIDRERLKAIGLGELQPIASNETDTGRQSNRRVEFKLIR